MKKSLTKEERVKKRSDFRRIFSNGKVKSCQGARLYWTGNDYSYNRFAVTLTKKFGKAVIRNKNKRWIREIYREIKGSIQSKGYDFLFFLYPGDYSFEQRKAQVHLLINKSGVTHG
jgi:ribonuclease P protein component